MECNPTSSVKRHAGFTLVEYVMAMGIGMLVLAAVCVLWTYASTNCAALLNYVDMANSSKLALDKMSLEIRNAQSLTSIASKQIVFVNQDAQEMRYAYDSTNKTMTEIRAGQQKVLLTGCDSFQFSGFKRVTTNSSFVLSSTTDPALCKVVQVMWLCSRSLVGNRKNTELQYSAQIVVRNL
jgi:hypothetical protein